MSKISEARFIFEEGVYRAYTTDEKMNIDQKDAHIFYTIPEKPRKAIAIMLTVMSAIGRPLKDFGTSHIARCSRRPAKRIIARP